MLIIQTGIVRKTTEMLKLATLPEPTLFLRPVPAFLQARLLQNILEQILNAEAMQRFAELSGKHFLFRTFDDVVHLGMTFTDDSIRVQENPAWDADVTISGNLPALIAPVWRTCCGEWPAGPSRTLSGPMTK